MPARQDETQRFGAVLQCILENGYKYLFFQEACRLIEAIPNFFQPSSHTRASHFSHQTSLKHRGLTVNPSDGQFEAELGIAVAMFKRHP